MKIKLLILVSCMCFISCTQIKEYREEKRMQDKEQQMEKDALEYLELIGKAGRSGTFGDSGENGFAALFNVALNADVRIKKNSILQKYQGDDLLKFSKALQSEYKKKIGEDMSDLLLLMFLESD
jgi:hypothetical protein